MLERFTRTCAYNRDSWQAVGNFNTSPSTLNQHTLSNCIPRSQSDTSPGQTRPQQSSRRQMRPGEYRKQVRRTASVMKSSTLVRDLLISDFSRVRIRMPVPFATLPHLLYQAPTGAPMGQLLPPRCLFWACFRNPLISPSPLGHTGIILPVEEDPFFCSSPARPRGFVSFGICFPRALACPSVTNFPFLPRGAPPLGNMSTGLGTSAVMTIDRAVKPFCSGANRAAQKFLFFSLSFFSYPFRMRAINLGQEAGGLCAHCVL